MSELLTAIVQYNKCYYDTITIIIIQFPVSLQLSVLLSGILIVNNGGNVLLIEFALVEGMPELLMFVVINAVSIACIVVRYFIKNTISVITSIMLHVKAA